MKTDYIPEGFYSITPYLHVEDAPNLMGFLKHAFDAEEVDSTKLPDGTVINAKMKIGNSMIELSEVRGGFKPLPCAIHLYVPDADAVYRKAVELGAASVMEPANQFYGDREAFVIDPCGNHWYIATKIEEVPKAEMQKRIAYFMARTNEV